MSDGVVELARESRSLRESIAFSKKWDLRLTEQVGVNPQALLQCD